MYQLWHILCLYQNPNIDLLSTQSETLEICDLQFGICFFQHFSYSFLCIHYILLIQQADFFQELTQTTLSNVLDHLLRQVSSFLCRNSSDDFLCFGIILGSNPAFGHVGFHVIFASYVSRVNACFLQSSLNSLLYLFSLCFLNSNFDFLLFDFF